MQKVKENKEGGTKEYIVSMLILFCFWMLISFPQEISSSRGMTDLIQHIIVGLFLSAFAAKLSCHPILTLSEISMHTPARLIKLFFYIFWLAWQIVLAGIDVAKRVWGKELLISPGIIEFHTPLKGEIPITMNANSITLTPGTITLDARSVEDGSVFVVHCITQDAVEATKEEGGMVKQIMAIYGDSDV